MPDQAALDLTGKAPDPTLVECAAHPRRTLQFEFVADSKNYYKVRLLGPDGSVLGTCPVSLTLLRASRRAE